MRAPLMAVAGVLLSASVLHAYAPPPAYIFELVVARRIRQKLDALRVVVKRTPKLEDGTDGPPVEETITYRAGGRVRHEWKDASGVHARISDGTTLLQVDGDKKQKGKPVPDLFDALWTVGREYSDRPPAVERGRALMEAWKIPETPVGYARMDGRIAWVVGADNSAAQTPQLWVDKDDHLPLRCVHLEDNVVVDVRYRQWRSAVGGNFFPGRVETWRGGKLVEVAEPISVDVTPKISERDFSLD